MSKSEILIAIVAAGCCLAGCAEQEITIHNGPTLTAAELGAPQGAYPASGHVILEPGRSEGRFPAALAVARLEATSETTGTAWRLVTLKPEVAVYWNSLFKTMPDVREVVVLDPQALTTPAAPLPEVETVAMRRQATLCFVYGSAAAEADHAALTGVLLDSASKAVIAVVQAEAGPADYQPPPEDRLSGDLRHRDPEHIAVCKLQAQVRQCVLELIGRDQRRIAGDANPWQAAESRPAPPEVIVIPAGPTIPPARRY